MKIFQIETKEGKLLRRYEVYHLPSRQTGTVVAENPANAVRQCGKWKLEECEVKSVPFYMAQVGDNKLVKEAGGIPSLRGDDEKNG